MESLVYQWSLELSGQDQVLVKMTDPLRAGRLTGSL